MSASNSRNPAASGGSSSAGVSPNNTATVRNARCVTGVGFIKTMHGILNIVIIVALVCVLISTGIADSSDAVQADRISVLSSAKVSAVQTRNAVIVFTVFGFILIIADTILHVTSRINNLSATFESSFIIIMFIFAGIYFILACCAAAWEKKMDDTVGKTTGLKHKGAAAAASAFLFVTTGAILVDFISRWTHPVQIEI